MKPSRRGIKFVMRIRKSQFRQRMSRSRILGIMACKNRANVHCGERIIDHCGTRFLGQAFPPILILQMKSNFEHFFRGIIGPQPATADMFAGFQAINWSVLNSGGSVGFNFPGYPLLDLCFRHCSIFLYIGFTNACKFPCRFF